MNRELSELLVRLGAPDVVEKTLALQKAANEHAEQAWYANVLREAKTWTPEQRRQYFAWFKTAAADFKGGNSMKKFIERVRDEAVAKLTDAEKAPLAALLETAARGPAARHARGGAPVPEKLDGGRTGVPDLDKAAHGRNFRPRKGDIFQRAVHPMPPFCSGAAAASGPDLSAVGSRFNHHDILESIIEPSKVISEQYASLIVTTKGGDTLMGLGG